MTDSSITSGFELNARLENGRIVVEMAVTAAAAIDLPGLRLAVQNARAPLALIIDRDERGFRAPRLSLASPPVGLPSAAEAALDLPGAIGGGRLEYSPAEDTWRGAVTVRVGPVSVQGFAIVSGLAGRFSLLVLLSAEFTPPLQLPFGFTLQGVGGMVGVNRRPDIGALTTALRDGDLSKLLFPQNAARESARLLPVLDRCFPGSPGDFVVGPMLKIGWPTPALVSATVGVLIASTSVIVLGRVAITLPFEQAALIRLEAFVLGVVDGTGLLLSATLTNSHIVGIPVEGDIRLCVRTGANPQFAISAGGFHPAYTPPDGMADMKRIGMQISPGPILCARLSAYLGVTTDSVHFGATVHLSAGFDGFKISGRFAFDALIALAPFGFHAGFRARVAVECADFEVASIELGGQFSGPAPYRISGHATVSILFFDVDIDLPEISWGSRESAVLPAARDPLATLVGELRRRECWTPTDPSGVLGSKIRPGVEAGVLLHPQGQMQFRQNAVPLNVLLTRMDAVQLPIPVTITVEDGAGDRLEMLRCAFVASQFFALDEKTVLSSPGYSEFEAGFVVNPRAARASGTASADLTPETSVLAKSFRCFRILADAPHVRTIRYDAVLEPRVPEPLVRLRDPGLAVLASTEDLTTLPATVGSGWAFVHEHERVASLSRGGLDVAAIGGLQTISAWEVLG